MPERAPFAILYKKSYIGLMSDTQKIESEMEQVAFLETEAPYGTEYQLWEKRLEGPIRHLFGEDGLKLFKQQTSVVIPRDEEVWKRQYINDLRKKKRALEGMLADPRAFKRLETKTTKQIKIPGGFKNFIIAVAVVVVGSLILHYFFGIR